MFYLNFSFQLTIVSFFLPPAPLIQVVDARTRHSGEQTYQAEIYLGLDAQAAGRQRTMCVRCGLSLGPWNKPLRWFKPVKSLFGEQFCCFFVCFLELSSKNKWTLKIKVQEVASMDAGGYGYRSANSGGPCRVDKQQAQEDAATGAAGLESHGDTDTAS